MKSRKSAFSVDALAVKCWPPASLTPSPAHLAGLGEKASCDPICLLLINVLLSLPRAWQLG